MKKIVVAYLIGFLISWPTITGWVNADSKYDAKYRFASLYDNPETAKYEYRSHWGFAVLWGGMASTMWPVFIPGCYIIGLAQHGWTLAIQPEKAGTR